MKTLRLLTVSFDTEIQPYETPAFRGAVIEKVGIQNEWYHNHNNAPGAASAYHYRYPLVQYKQDKGRPMLVFIDKGVDEAQHFFAQATWDLNFAGKDHRMSISKMHVKPYDVGVYDRDFVYNLRHWIALNERNYQQFQDTESLKERVELLNRILSANIIAFVKGIDCRLAQRFDCHIIEIGETRPLRYEGTKIMTFEVRFKTNVLLPPYIGLGKGTSQGFGVVKPYRKPKDNQPE
jgi:hypothetical protein